MSNWAKEEIWVARDDRGQIVRVSDISPQEMLEEAERLRIVANAPREG